MARTELDADWYREAFARRLRAVLRMRGFWVAELASRTGMHARSIERIVGGATMPTVVTVADIAAALQVKFEDLMPVMKRIDAHRRIRATKLSPNRPIPKAPIDFPITHRPRSPRRWVRLT